jgi:hypothetical protein
MAMGSRMTMVSRSSGFAFALMLAGLCLGAPAAHAQGSPVPYWTTAWPAGFGNSFTAAQGSNTYIGLSGIGLSGFDGNGAAGGGFSSRFDLPNGWFVGSERGGAALNGFSGAWSNIPSLSYEGTQFGYNFKNAEVPLSVYAGFGTLKYNTGINSPLPGFDSTSSASSPGYSAHVGVEFRPTSNLSLSVGASFAQQPQGYDTGINSLVASPFAYGRH